MRKSELTFSLCVCCLIRFYHKLMELSNLPSTVVFGFPCEPSAKVYKSMAPVGGSSFNPYAFTKYCNKHYLYKIFTKSSSHLPSSVCFALPCEPSAEI